MRAAAALAAAAAPAAGALPGVCFPPQRPAGAEAGPPRRLFARRAALPDAFDWRDAAPQCASLREARDEGACGANWAMIPAAVATDRHCIATNGTQAPRFSAQDVASCCKSVWCQNCDGGTIGHAFDYMNATGAVTGGSYNDTSMCYSYQVPPCMHFGLPDPSGKLPSCDGARQAAWPGPKCTEQCENGADWAGDKWHTGKAYKVRGEGDIMQEIFERGPVAAFWYFNDDIAGYKGGVYQPANTSSFYGDADSKLLGWGSDEAGVKYWIASMPWGPQWGDAGFFKILRGANVGCIENSVNGPVAAEALPRA